MPPFGLPVADGDRPFRSSSGDREEYALQEVADAYASMPDTELGIEPDSEASACSPRLGPMR